TLNLKLGLLNGTTGETTPEGSSELIAGEPCYGTGGDADIASGTGVTVKNGSGSIIATTTLDNGVAGGGICTFNISIKVPQTAFYQVEIGQGHGTTSYSLSQLENEHWSPPELGLGG